MNNDYVHIMMNPTNLKILQKIMSAGEADTRTISESIPEVPTSSLYRHLAQLQDAGIIKIVSQTHKRGALKKTYAINQAFSQKNPDPNQLASIAGAGICIIAGELQQYFESGCEDIGKDCVELSNVVMNINEKEFKKMKGEILEIMKKYMGKNEKGRKLRRISFISSPVAVKDGTDGNN